MLVKLSYVEQVLRKRRLENDEICRAGGHCGIPNTNRLNFYLFTPTVWGWMTVEATVQFHSSAGQLAAR